MTTQGFSSARLLPIVMIALALAVGGLLVVPRWDALAAWQAVGLWLVAALAVFAAEVGALALVIRGRSRRYRGPRGGWNDRRGDGGAGVREPRRPRTPPQFAAQARELPVGEESR